MKLLTVKDVAAILNCSHSFVLERARSGELIGCRMGRLWRFSQGAVDNYVQLCEVRPKAKGGLPRRVVKNSTVGLPILSALAAKRGIKF